jgi:predicted secreted acid phosphatase
MKKLSICFLLILFSAALLAKEPTNLSLVKAQLKHYHDNGEYLHDINAVTLEAMRYLTLRLKSPHPGKIALVLDIDETSLSNYPDMVKLDFGGSMKEVIDAEDKGHDSAIEPVLRLYRFAIAHHVAVIFITGRYEYQRDATIHNLKSAGFTTWDDLIFRQGIYNDATATVYKTAMRKQLQQQGYDIVLNVGDQKSDLGQYADKNFKLPDPYYFIP